MDHGNPVSHAFYLHLFVAPTFCGSRPIREKRENYAPRKIWRYTVYCGMTLSAVALIMSRAMMYCDAE